MSENAETLAVVWRPENSRFDTEAQVTFERARTTGQGLFIFLRSSIMRGRWD